VHCAAAKSDALIRWTVLAIRSWNLTDFTPLNPDVTSPPIGYWVMGNILNCAGKSSGTSNNSNSSDVAEYKQ
jgi:hypothetical protein